MWENQEREKHYIVKDCTAREDYVPPKHGVTEAPIPNPMKMLLPSQHINLGLMNNSAKVVDKSGEVLLYWSSKFPRLSSSKVKREIFVGSSIRQYRLDENFDRELNSFKSFFRDFLDNNKRGKLPRHRNIII
jgi:hypothetical protein